jgi:hypothetical protein
MVDGPPIDILAATLLVLSSEDRTKLAAILSAKSFFPPDCGKPCPTLQNQQEGLACPKASANPASSSDAGVKLGTSDLASCLALLTPKYPDLALLIRHWEALPEPIKTAIMALVNTITRAST